MIAQIKKEELQNIMRKLYTRELEIQGLIPYVDDEAEEDIKSVEHEGLEDINLILMDLINRRWEKEIKNDIKKVKVSYYGRAAQNEILNNIKGYNIRNKDLVRTIINCVDKEEQKDYLKILNEKYCIL